MSTYTEKFPNAPIILSGNFNLYPQSKSIKDLSRTYYDLNSLLNIQTEQNVGVEHPSYPNSSLNKSYNNYKDNDPESALKVDYMFVPKKFALIPNEN